MHFKFDALWHFEQLNQASTAKELWTTMIRFWAALHICKSKQKQKLHYSLFRKLSLILRTCHGRNTEKIHFTKNSLHKKKNRKNSLYILALLLFSVASVKKNTALHYHSADRLTLLSSKQIVVLTQTTMKDSASSVKNRLIQSNRKTHHDKTAGQTTKQQATETS